MAQDLAGRSVVVTGGTGALGSAVVERALGSGATVWVPCFHLREMESFGLKDAGSVRLVPGVDLRAEASVEGFFEEVSRSGARVWASIHVAGGFAMGPITETSAETMMQQFTLNALSVMLCAREAVKRMRAGGDGGRIVNVSALAGGRDAVGGMSAYTTAKGAVATFTRCLAEEVRGDGILVNAVVPGVMDTPANRRAMPDADPGRWARVADVADAMWWLASPANAVVSGAVVPVQGRG